MKQFGAKPDKETVAAQKERLRQEIYAKNKLMKVLYEQQVLLQDQGEKISTTNSV